MNEADLIGELEVQIENMEGMKHTFNVRLDDAREKLRGLRFKIKYPKEGRGQDG